MLTILTALSIFISGLIIGYRFGRRQLIGDAAAEYTIVDGDPFGPANWEPPVYRGEDVVLGAYALVSNSDPPAQNLEQLRRMQ